MTKVHTVHTMLLLLLWGMFSLGATAAAFGGHGASLTNEIANTHTMDVCEHLIQKEHEALPPFCTQSGGGSLDHLIISEVLFDLKNDGSQGSELGGDNEWVEIHNPTTDAVDLNGWRIGNNFDEGDVLSGIEFIIDPGTYVVVTDSETTADFWDLSGVTVIYLGSSISGGLRNAGDHVALFDSGGVEVDAVSWGDDVRAFDPAVSGGSDGESIIRTDVREDTDSSADWEIASLPMPGS